MRIVGGQHPPAAVVAVRRQRDAVGVGARADLVVLDRDPFAAPAEEIASARVARTYVGGELVYDADAARDL